MPFEILIDTASIRQNPAWVRGQGVRHVVVSGHPVENLRLVYRYGRGWQKIELRGRNVNDMVCVSMETREPDGNEIAQIPRPEGWINDFFVEPAPTQELFDLDGPQWLYEYQSRLISCDHCGHEFEHTDLQTLAILGDPDGSSTRVCPRCATVDCCELEYQELTQAMIAAAQLFDRQVRFGAAYGMTNEQRDAIRNALPAVPPLPRAELEAFVRGELAEAFGAGAVGAFLRAEGMPDRVNIHSFREWLQEVGSAHIMGFNYAAAVVVLDRIYSEAVARDPTTAYNMSVRTGRFSSANPPTTAMPRRINGSEDL